ncbi:lantibiotic dehydratase [Micromonospora sp. WMMD882]|uniref:lantibiotic dehydratase n=1 Tax=Micromonospora sp. WMMD882 TaxID=3015151 RepID=UPI00248B3D14|nr:lantibiotic dehydratase [Micromonospora sp. WMMD882]WBB77319.1 lantibiotic dehydratase [Micromonospora sp. WMMD882]
MALGRAPAATRRVRVGPVVVRRRCGSGPQVLRDLSGDRVWAAAGRVAEAEKTCRTRGAAAADVISALVPLATPAERRRLLRARRDAYNGRVLTTVAGELLDVGPVAAYERARSELDRRWTELRTALTELDRATRATVHDRLTDPDFAASVELSVPGLLAEIRRSGRHRPGSARDRRRLLTVFRLLQRSATKPSPFARLAEATLLVPGAGRRPPHRRVRVDRQALDWVQHWVRGRGLRSVTPEQVWVTTNPTATVGEPAEGRVSWLVTGGPVDDLRTAACPDRLAGLLRRLRSPRRLRDLSPDGTVPDQLAALLRCGLLEVGLRPPGHGRQVLDGVLAALPATTGEDDADDLRAALRLLRDIEADPSPVPGALTAPARAGLERLATACGVSTAGTDRLLVTDDLVGVVDEPAPALDGEVLADLGRVKLIAPLLAPELPFQLAGTLAFRDRFGTDAVPLLTAYRWFVGSGRAAADAMVAESSRPLLRRTLELRAGLTDLLRALAAGSPGAHEVRLDGAELDRLADALPDEVPEWACAAWPVQFAGDRVVLNGLGCGYGRFAARVAAGLGGAPVGLLREWAGAADVGEPDALAVDVTARFGATANERPRLLPYSLAFPGHALECDPEARIDPGDCTVRVDPARGRLLLHSSALPGRPLVPVPQNATLTQLAPPFFRWLRRLGPATGSTLAFWDQVDGDVAAGSRGVRHYPRLVLGRLVLARRTWKVPPTALPAGADDAARTVGWHRWCAGTGVPRQFFVRAVTLPEPWDVVRGRASDEWVGQARSRSGSAVRKPVYVDLSQPRCWPEGTAGALTLTEPLPDPAALALRTHAAEYVIETSQPPRRRSRV